MQPKISIIVATDRKRGIGKNKSIPWHIKGEQKRFKEITTPHPMIMGRTTFESIGRILPNRPHIIVTRDTNYKVDGATVVHSLREAIQKAKELDNKEIFIIGGGQIFKETIALADKLYITVINADFDCDTFFPEYLEFKKVIRKEEKEDEGLKYTYWELEK